MLQLGEYAKGTPLLQQYKFNSRGKEGTHKGCPHQHSFIFQNQSLQTFNKTQGCPDAKKKARKSSSCFSLRKGKFATLYLRDFALNLEKSPYLLIA